MKSQIKSVKFIYYEGLENLRDSYYVCTEGLKNLRDSCYVCTEGFPTCYFKDINAFQANVHEISYIYLANYVYLVGLTRIEYNIGKEIYR